MDEGVKSTRMDDNPEKELQTKLLPQSHHKGGIITMPFIIVNEGFEKVASYGLQSNMIFYLMNVYHMDAVTGSSLIYVWSALSTGLAIFGAFVSDSYLGRFRVIAIGSFSSLLGVTFLWLTSILPQLTPSLGQATPAQVGFLFGSLGLMSIGTACIRTCSLAFGADQLQHLNNQRLTDSYFNWYYASATLSTVIGSTVLVYIQNQLGWRIGFAVSVLAMLCSALIFLLGSSLYVKFEVKKSPFSGFVQVLIFAFRNRKIRLLPDDCYNHSIEMESAVLTHNLRFLNKACVTRDTNSISPDMIPTVEKVESLKSIIRIIPIWSSGIIVFANVSQIYPTLQAQEMNRNITSWFEIPAASFGLFSLLTLTIWIAFYDRVLVPVIAKLTHAPRGFHPKTRMGIGIIMSILATVVAAVVEAVRRDLANSNTAVDMSAMWLLPQFMLLGLCQAFNSVGQMEFYYSELPKSMASLGMAVFLVSMASAAIVGYLLTNIVDLVTGQGENISWLTSDINKGHVDYYYWLLSILNTLNLFYYLICCCVTTSSSIETTLSNDIDEEACEYVEHKF